MSPIWPDSGHIKRLLMSHFCFYFTCAPGPKCRVEKTSVFMVYFCVRLTLEITRGDLLPRILSRITNTEVLASTQHCKGKSILYTEMDRFLGQDNGKGDKFWDISVVTNTSLNSQIFWDEAVSRNWTPKIFIAYIHK